MVRASASLRAASPGSTGARSPTSTFATGSVSRSSWSTASHRPDAAFVLQRTVAEHERAFAGRERNEFRGSDFSGMKLEEVSLSARAEIIARPRPKADTVDCIIHHTEVIVLKGEGYANRVTALSSDVQ
jgi:hypothetical protein